MKDLEKAVVSVLLGEKKVLTAKQQQIDVHEPEKDELTAKDFEMLRAGKKAKPMKEEENVKEAMSHQASTTMKHVQNATPGEKKAAKDIKPGVAGYRDRIAMLKSAEARGGLKKEETEQVDEARFKKGEDVGKPGMNFAKIAKAAGKKYGSKEAGARVAGAVLKKVLAKEDYTEEELNLIEMAIEEGWDDMLKAAKERAKPQPSGGAGMKKGTRYGGSKQKEETPAKPMKEDKEYNFGDYLKAAKAKYGEEEAVKIANDAFNSKDMSIFSNDSEA